MEDLSNGRSGLQEDRILFGNLLEILCRLHAGEQNGVPENGQRTQVISDSRVLFQDPGQYSRMGYLLEAYSDRAEC